MIAEMIQFHLPNGTQERVTGEIADVCKPNYEAMQKAGCRLTGEILRTGHVSVCIEHPEGDVAIRLVENGPGKVSTAVTEMLLEFRPEHVAEMLRFNQGTQQ